MLLLVALATVVTGLPLAFPEQGFRPVQGARGPSSSSSQIGAARPTRSGSSSSSHFGGNVFDNSFDGGSSGSYNGGSSDQLGDPDKTIYVRLPQHGGSRQQSPKSAGPPQKHYRIVIIRSPNPPPVQPILPPRTEQKTIIYVLHQKPKATQQQVIETPVVKHPPQVLFVGYDDELSSQDLQQLAKGDHTGFQVSSQQGPAGDGFQDNQVFGSFDGVAGALGGAEGPQSTAYNRFSRQSFPARV